MGVDRVLGRQRVRGSFRVSLMPVLPVVSVLASLYLMLNLPAATWLRFVVWMALGVVLYFGYGRRHSRFSTPGGREDAAAANSARHA